jgi:hypothetical protein
MHSCCLWLQVRVYLVRLVEHREVKQRYMDAVAKTFQAWCSQARCPPFAGFHERALAFRHTSWQA